MNKITLKGRKIISNILKGFSLTTAMFIFQSCYGMPPSTYYGQECLVKGKVISGSNNKGIKGIQIISERRYSTQEVLDRSFGITDDNGNFSFFVHGGRNSNFSFLFKDIDGVQGGLYENKTVNINTWTDEIKIDVTLNEIQQDSTSLQ